MGEGGTCPLCPYAGSAYGYVWIVRHVQRYKDIGMAARNVLVVKILRVLPPLVMGEVGLRYLSAFINQQPSMLHQMHFDYNNGTFLELEKPPLRSL